MALLPYGPYGPLIGKVGKLVSYILNGQVVTRTIGHKRTRHSNKQLANYQAMSVTMDFLSSMTPFINSSFEIEARGTVKNQHNLATSYNKKQALKGEYPNIRVDYSKVVFSYGDLAVAENLRMSKTETGVQISWDTNYGRPDDLVMVMVYHPLKGFYRGSINACRRDTGNYFVAVAEKEDLEQQMEVYICFKSADGKKISNSVYLGNFNGEADGPEEQKKQEKYLLVKKRFDQVSAEYFRLQALEKGIHTRTKSFRNLEREYQVLRQKLEHMPGKPG